MTELTTQIEEEQRQRDEAREAAMNAERRANLIIGELDELRTALEQAERARKAAENELNDAADRISDVSTQNANLSSQRRQLESTVAAMQADLDEAVAELKNSEERSKKAGKIILILIISILTIFLFSFGCCSSFRRITSRTRTCNTS